MIVLYILPLFLSMLAQEYTIPSPRSILVMESGDAISVAENSICFIKVHPYIDMIMCHQFNGFIFKEPLAVLIRFIYGLS